MDIKALLRHPIRQTVEILGERGYYNNFSDKTYLKLMFFSNLGKKLNLKNPITFNEKLQWLKLYDRKDIYTTMVDKYKVKEYVADLIGEEYVIKTLGVWDKFEDIDFDKLPDKFVIKTNHSSGGVAVCRDKSTFDFKSAEQKMTRSLAFDYFLNGREWPYKNVERKILAEEYMQDGDNLCLPVYKVFNFDGKPTLIQAIQNDKTADETIDYFDTEWNKLDLRQNFNNSEVQLIKPEQLGEMLKLAEKLSAGHPFLRTDFYVINGKIYFSEFTFYSDCGFKKFEPEYWDKKLGDLMDLSLVEKKDQI